jgi:hypothetical protein
MKRLLALTFVTLLAMNPGCMFDDDDDGDMDGDATHSLSGVVLDLDGNGIEGAAITLSGTTGGMDVPAPRTVLSGSDGSYLFEGVGDGSYVVVAARAGYRFVPDRHTVAVEGGSVMLDSFAGIVLVPDEFAEYTITFTATWSAGTHPLDFPQAPHFSPIIGAYHNDRVSFWKAGGLATPGIKALAELGARDIFEQEILAEIAEGDANVLLYGGGIPLSPGAVAITFTAHRDFHYVTLATMIAPSPDWFVGVTGLNMFDTDDWRDNIVVDLYTHDAGTDSGLTYTAPNMPTPVPDEITLIESYAFASQGIPIPVGTMAFTRTGQ